MRMEMSNKNILSLDNIHVKVEGQEVVKGVSIEINEGETHAIMGPNGSGKSSLAQALAGHPAYEITEGSTKINGKDLLEMDATERSLAGLFLGFQYPQAIPGVTVANFLRAAIKARFGDDSDEVRSFRKNLKANFEILKVDQSFANRYLNEGFSGGEKKRLEILQMLVLDPTMAILDETDSGLDIDALKVVSSGINEFINKSKGVLLVTHYQRMLNYIKPHHVHVMKNGKFVLSGGPELALQLEDQGYDWLSGEQKETEKAGV